jgi:hypothetical protein
VIAQARRSHSGAGHLRGWLSVRCQEPPVSYRPGHSALPGPRCRPGGGLERLGGGDTGSSTARPSRVDGRCGPELRSAPDHTWVSSGTEECLGPSRAVPEREEPPGHSEPGLRRTRRHQVSVGAVVWAEYVVRDSETGETAPHRLLVAGRQRRLRDVLSDHVLAEPDPNSAPVLSRRHFRDGHYFSPRNSEPLQPVGLTGCHGSNGARAQRDRSRTWTGPLPDLFRTSRGHLGDSTLSWGISRDNV